MQVDFNMPRLLGAEFVDEDNTRKHPVMLHRAIVGSMERFLGILIENHAGALPLWLAPGTGRGDGDHRAPGGVRARGRGRVARRGIRAGSDLRNEKITYKIREHSIQKLPYQVVVGDKEVAARTVSARTRAGEQLAPLSLEAFISRLKSEIEARH
jgi:threonyl-tRNA synthetase